MGRLKDGVSIAEANASMVALGATIERERPSPEPGRSVSVEPFRNNFVRDSTKQGLWLLLGAVGFLLLIACANVANLLLARGSARQRELAVRTSMGATRGAIVRQLLVESLVVSLAGGAARCAAVGGAPGRHRRADASVHAAVGNRDRAERAGARCLRSPSVPWPASWPAARRPGRPRART